MNKLPFKQITDLAGKDLAGKYVLVRADFNVPIKKGQVTNNFRLKQTLNTLKYLQTNKAKILIISHLGRDGKDSLKPVALELNKFIKVDFSAKLFAEEKISQLEAGQILLLENLRQFKEEDKNELKFTKHLAGLAEIYINEAFSVSHRRSASVVGVPKILPSYAGFNFVEEYNYLSKVSEAKKPFIAILGGAKFQTKLPALQKLLSKADFVLVGGALAHSLYRKMGYEIGKSLIDDGIKGLANILKDKKVHVPNVVVVKTTSGVKTKLLEEVRPSDVIVDISEESLLEIEEQIKTAKFIFWNGPLGNFEKGFSEGTERLAKMIAGSKAFSVVGGGDTVSAIENLNLNSEFDFVSTAGGAGLEFITKETLPGVKALEK